jgi:hypothetical protein
MSEGGAREEGGKELELRISRKLLLKEVKKKKNPVNCWILTKSFVARAPLSQNPF